MPLKLAHAGREYDIDLVDDQADAATVRIEGRTFELRRNRDGSVGLDGRVAWVARAGEARWVFLDGRSYELTELRPASRRRRAGHDGALTAPMPATVRRIAVSPGDAVKAGDLLIVLEAMKMELPVRAPADGRVEAIHCQPGELVQPDRSLIDLE
jgi:3-methylcrotonyl-CoA carboxylase alpha subunit